MTISVYISHLHHVCFMSLPSLCICRMLVSFHWADVFYFGKACLLLVTWAVSCSFRNNITGEVVCGVWSSQLCNHGAPPTPPPPGLGVCFLIILEITQQVVQLNPFESIVQVVWHVPSFVFAQNWVLKGIASGKLTKRRKNCLFLSDKFTPTHWLSSHKTTLLFLLLKVVELFKVQKSNANKLSVVKDDK
jgi:hypothetical protein